jgi:hypothetical protein
MDIRINTWTELQEALFADSWSDAIRRFRSDFAFRGMPRMTHGPGAFGVRRLAAAFKAVPRHAPRRLYPYF